MNKLSYTQALLELSAKIDQLADLASRQEEILTAVNQINGRVRDHGELLAAHQQWRTGHEAEHSDLDGRLRTLGSRLWAVGGGGGLLGLLATILQFLGK
jgi:chromosome segregation ATPase